jgi:uncharacterized damage-inducible protein DinB
MPRLSIDTEMLIVALEDHTSQVQHYLDRKTGEVVMVPEGGLDEVDDELAKDMGDEPERFEYIEALPSRDGYQVMADFVASLAESEAKRDLERALQRRGPFRNFKETLASHPDLRDQWFRHHDRALKGVAEAWLRERGIEADLQPLASERVARASTAEEAAAARKAADVLADIREGRKGRIESPSEAADLRYPIGEFKADAAIAERRRRRHIQSLTEFPGRLREAVYGLSPEQLDTPYRPGGWTVRQVVHHLADSHMNSYIRMKLAVTEEQPTVKPYDEKRWAELEDARTAPLEFSLALVEALHKRWVMFLQSLQSSDFSRTFHHPESGIMSLDTALQYYEWHGRHHIGHITSLRQRMGWA